VHSRTGLGTAITTSGGFIVDSEDTGFVAVQRQLFTVLCQITPMFGSDFKKRSIREMVASSK